MSAPNRNSYWGHIFVDELARSGLRAVCIAPGSRSTPLTMAFAEHPAIEVYSHIDERSAAFFALGLAQASEQPVAVLCSSGTATANFFPAVIEAKYAQVPLIVLTADRPHELRDSGANQTVDQVKLYGDQVLWAVDVALPESDPPAVAVRNLRTLACRALDRANGLPRGPVHLNFPFRKPLEPTAVPGDITTHEDAAPRSNDHPFTTFVRGTITPTDAQIAALADQIGGAQRGLVICGPRCPSGDFPAAVERLADAAGFPLLADPLSGVRYHAENALGGYDTFLRAASEWESPDVVVHFGAMPTSQTLIDYLNRVSPEKRIKISTDGVWADADHRIDTFVWADPAIAASQLAGRLGERPRPQHDDAWAARFTTAETICWETLGAAVGEDYFDGTILSDVVDLLPEGALLYIASSLPVRHLDQFGRPNRKRLRVLGNRGASGIDGTVSSALGAAASTDAPLVLVSGDLAFYHDLNGLLAVKRCGVNATMIVINNDGGGIFRRLPVAEFDPPFTDLFLTPHGLNFEQAAQMYGIDYVRADERPLFRRNLLTALTSERAAIIEVVTDVEHDHARRLAIIDEVVAQVKAGLIATG
ncbi:MAG: 2-succinyl-5-enolpyruvyl-6-hydroxy-3-cyclohexene-1-carboxylic-acid synthase [Chloroflexi bacterium]|nr:2-succinyl-5-enolpyruvyl-6-hydroxy-3-cyclohexene-1-carboxylic-acid synthase [Chloroflexota bacterium]